MHFCSFPMSSFCKLSQLWPQENLGNWTSIVPKKTTKSRKVSYFIIILKGLQGRFFVLCEVALELHCELKLYTKDSHKYMIFSENIIISRGLGVLSPHPEPSIITIHRVSIWRGDRPWIYRKWKEVVENWCKNR